MSMMFNFNLEEIKYIKITYKNNESTFCTTKAGVKKLDKKEILACGKFENGLDILTPQEVTLSIICNDGLYKTNAQLKSVENDEPYVFFTLETPNGAEYEQNREYFRVNANFECIYKFYDNGNLKEYKAITADISANGVSIILINPITTGINPELSININNRYVQTPVRYIRSEKFDKGYKLSFAFTNLSEADRDYISQACIQKQIEQRRKLLR